MAPQRRPRRAPDHGPLTYNREMSSRTRLLIAALSTGLVSYVALGSVLGRALGDTSYTQISVFNEVIRLVLDSYVDPVNLDRAMAGARMGLTEALDGDSAFLDADGLKAYQQAQASKGGDTDAGILLSRRYGFLVVVAVRPGGPAAKAGVKDGDGIKSIDGRYCRTVSVPEAERLLRGAPGSTAKLRLLRQGSDPIEASLVRERPGPPEGPEMKTLEGGVGYVKLTDVTPQSADKMAGDIESLKASGAASIVLDLRGASFGSPEGAVDVAELLLKGGVVTRLVGRKVDERTFSADPAKSIWGGPMATLVDGSTAGPGEIVAAALLDSGRSPIVGEHTFGRAPSQKLVPLPTGALLLTVAKYESPKGNPIHGKGVEPTVVVPAGDEDQDEATTEPAKDTILDKALEVLAKKGEKAA
jgi:carboxyl-terminal processing protease